MREWVVNANANSFAHKCFAGGTLSWTLRLQLMLVTSETWGNVERISIDYRT